MTPSKRRRAIDISKAIRILLVAMVFVTPGVFDLGSAKPFDYVKVATVWVFGWLAVGLWVTQMLRGESRFGRSRMVWLALAFLGAGALATVFSPTKWISVLGWYNRYGGLLTTLIYVLVFLVIAHVYREHPKWLPELMWGIAAGAIVLFVYIGMQYLGIDPIKWARPRGGPPGQPYFGTMGNANFAGGYLGLTAPWLYFAFRMARQSWQRYALVVATVAQLGTLWLTSARNGLVSVAVAGLMLVFLHRDRLPRLVKVGVVVVAAVGVLFAALIIVHPGSDKAPSFARPESIFRSQTIRVRGEWWTAGMRMFLHRPITGYGPDTFVTVYPRYLSEKAARIGDAEQADKPHNIFVEHAAQTGILGLGAFLWLLFVAFRRGMRRVRELQGEQQALLITFLAILAGYAAQGFFSIDVAAIAIVGWVVLGGIAALADPPQPKGEPKPPRSRSKVLTALVLVVAAVIATVGTAPLMAEHETKTARRTESADHPSSEVLAHYQRAMKWQPRDPVYVANAGAFIETQIPGVSKKSTKREYMRVAVDLYMKADRLQPEYHLWKLTVGKAIARLASYDGAEFSEAEPWLQEAIRLGPYDIRSSTAYGQVLKLWATETKDEDVMCRAVEQLRRALDLRPRVSPTLTDLATALAQLGQLDEATELLETAISRPRGIPRRADTDRATAVLKTVRKLQDQDKPPPKHTC